MATVTGYVEKIKYRNEENGYSVLSVTDGSEEYVLVGNFTYISEGERIEATGRMVEHSIYGEQLAVESYEKTAENGRTRKYYHLTKKGQRTLGKKREEWETCEKAVRAELEGGASFAF